MFGNWAGAPGWSSTSRQWAIRRSGRSRIRIAPPPTSCRKRPISHHWQDSTHISDDVVTVGLAYKKVKLEASGFHGAEPGENRWIIQQGAIDSWSSRLWFFPAKNWAAQVSVGRLTHPEALEPGDQVRSTASLEYTKPMQGASWSSSLIWGRNHETATGRNSEFVPRGIRSADNAARTL